MEPGYKGTSGLESYTSQRSIDGTRSAPQPEPQPARMSAPQKIASHVRKVSQLSTALGVSHVKNLSPAIEHGQQQYQVLHTAGLRQDGLVIGQTKTCKEGVMQQLGGEWEDCSPLPAKRWEQEVYRMRGFCLSVVGENKTKT